MERGGEHRVRHRRHNTELAVVGWLVLVAAASGIMAEFDKQLEDGRTNQAVEHVALAAVAGAVNGAEDAWHWVNRQIDDLT